MKLSTSTQRKLRALRLVSRAVANRYRPVQVQIVPMRRCNLACAYCNEYDKVSDPVPLPTVFGWLDRLADLETQSITISGGEPMMHPEIESIIAGIRERGIIAGLITNGYYLQKERIRGLNRAGLEYLQISIDNVKPDEVSKKSLKVLASKLDNLAECAEFHVNVNVVLGSGVDTPSDARVIARFARERGFATSVGIIHDGEGQLRTLSDEERDVYEETTRMGLGMYNRIRGFQQNLIEGRVNDWHCRAGARYLYICEDGLVHYCSQRRGTPGIPLAEYTREHVRQAYETQKDCAPYCTISCVHRSSTLDNWRHTLPKKLPILNSVLR